MYSSNQGGQKHDVFVGNLAFNTTEEQLQQAFSEIGKVVHVRLVTEGGKPKGYAFVEFADPQTALSAIRNMNDYELNGRRLRVNYSNSSNLEQLAGQLGMQAPQSNNNNKPSVSTGTSAVAESLKNMSKAEMYDVVAKLKEMADRDPDEARRLLSGHPQLPEALLFLMSKLDMVKTPTVDMTPARAADPRAAAMDPRSAAPPPMDPRAAAAMDPRRDPRAAMDPRGPPPPVDPRARGMDPRQQQPPPRMDPRQQQQQGYYPPPPQQAAPLDPAFVAQIMNISPQELNQLPPDKRQSILQLRQQITGGR